MALLGNRARLSQRGGPGELVRRGVAGKVTEVVQEGTEGNSGRGLEPDVGAGRRARVVEDPSHQTRSCHVSTVGIAPEIATRRCAGIDEARLEEGEGSFFA